MEKNTAKVLYANTTQVSNFVMDNLNLFSGNEIKVILFITRKTIGWHKETDFIRYTQLINCLGISKPTLSESVNHLIEMGLIIRTDKEGNKLDKVPQGYRKEIFYTLNKDFEPDWLKNFTSTGKKTLPYKTNSLQNSSKTSSKEDGKTRGLKSIREVLEEKGLKPNLNIDPEDRLQKDYQYYGLEICKVLGLAPNFRGRVMGFIKKTGNGYTLFKKAQELKEMQRLDSLLGDEKIRYLFGAYKKSL